MRRIIAALQVSLDGFIEGPNGELDWVGSWEDPFDVLPQIDTCILGGAMYPAYEEYWLSILADPKAVLEFSGKVPTRGEIDYAHFADRTPHLVLSRSLDKVAWATTRIVRDIEEIRRVKQQPGKDLHAVGGAALFGSLMNADLVDELRLVVHPVVLGAGKALFKDVTARRPLTLLRQDPLEAGQVRLTYGT